MLECQNCQNAISVRIKSSIFNQSRFFKVKIKDSGVLNFFFQNESFCVARMGREGGMSKFSTFCICNNP